MVQCKHVFADEVYEELQIKDRLKELGRKSEFSRLFSVGIESSLTRAHRADRSMHCPEFEEDAYFCFCRSQ